MTVGLGSMWIGKRVQCTYARFQWCVYECGTVMQKSTVNSVVSSLVEIGQIVTALHSGVGPLEYSDLLLVYAEVSEVQKRLWAICDDLARSSSLDRDELFTLLRIKYGW